MLVQGLFQELSKYEYSLSTLSVLLRVVQSNQDYGTNLRFLGSVVKQRDICYRDLDTLLSLSSVPVSFGTVPEDLDICQTLPCIVPFPFLGMAEYESGSQRIGNLSK